MTDVAVESCTALGGANAEMEQHPVRETSLGSLRIERALPVRERRLVGPWCFLDRFGPLSFGEEKPMDVAPHPHIGLQTVSWLIDGEVLHHDSLGYEALVQPGAVNVMTSGSGIAHSEETPMRNRGRLSGVQLWTALPEAARNVDPSLDYVERVPQVELSGGLAQVFAGSFAGVSSPARTYSEMAGVDLEIHRGETLVAQLDPAFEHALLIVNGDATFEKQLLEKHFLHYLGTGSSELRLKSAEGARVILVGGPPFPEKILMWWNFVARTPEEIRSAREQWESGDERFGEVTGYAGPRLAAPDLSRIARPNPAS